MAQIQSSVNVFNKQTANIQTSVSSTEGYIVAGKKITGLLKTVEALEMKMDYLGKKKLIIQFADFWCGRR